MKQIRIAGWSLLLLALTACQVVSAEGEQELVKPKQLSVNERELLNTITDYGIWIDVGPLDQSKQVTIGMDYYIDGERVEEGFEMVPDSKSEIESILIALNINGENNDQLDGIVQVNDDGGMARIDFNRSLETFNYTSSEGSELQADGVLLNQDEKTYIGSFQMGDQITPVELEDIESTKGPGHLLAFYIKYE
ncbi:hypothetical protein MKX54_08185 [Alkalihalobacillus sp. FSL R5-0424]